MLTAYTALEITALVRDITLIVFFVIGAIGVFIAIALGIKLYKKTNKVVDRVDRTVGKVEAMVSTVENTASTVKRTATTVNRGMRAGAFARSAVDTVFGKRNGKREKSEEEAGESK
jgi:hypothetical protein